MLKLVLMVQSFIVFVLIFVVSAVIKSGSTVIALAWAGMGTTCYTLLVVMAISMLNIQVRER